MLFAFLGMKVSAFLVVFFGAILVATAQRPHYCGIDIANVPPTPNWQTPPPGYQRALVQRTAPNDAFSKSSSSATLPQFGTCQMEELPIDKCWPNDNTWDCNLNIEERSTDLNVTWGNVGRLHRKHYIDGKEIFPGKCMAGQLTRYGYQQHLINGDNLMHAYVRGSNPLLPASLDLYKVSIRSTDVPRTLQSAQALLRGIYPWNTAPNATEFVDVYTVDATREYLYPNPFNCPLLAQYETQAKASPAYQQWTQQTMVPLMNEISQYYSMSTSSMPAPIAVFDCLSAHRCHNYPLPGNIPDTLYNRVVEAMEWEYSYIYNYPSQTEYGRLAMGQIYSELFNNFVAAIQNPNLPLKLQLFSAHDTSVMPFLNAIGAWDKQWAPYAALLQMELWTSPSGDPLIRWIYNRKEMVLPTCSGVFCDFQTFSNLVAPIILKDQPTACAISNTQTKQANFGVYTNDGW